MNAFVCFVPSFTMKESKCTSIAAYESCPSTISFWIKLICAANSCRVEALRRYRKKTKLCNQFQSTQKLDLTAEFHLVHLIQL